MEQTAESIRERAEKWVERNPEAWRFIVYLAKESAKNNRRTSIAKLVEDARAMGHINGYDQGFGINNTSRAVLARKLVSDYPELDLYIERRKSKLDELCQS